VPTDNEDVTRYIENAPSPQQEILRRLRELIGTGFPQLQERFGWSRPLYYDAGTAVCYLMANKNDVNLGFDFGSRLDDPKGLLTGTGINKRHIKIKDVAELDLDYYRQLLAQALPPP